MGIIQLESIVVPVDTSEAPRLKNVIDLRDDQPITTERLLRAVEVLRAQATLDQVLSSTLVIDLTTDS